eukprot:TRINITY_DN2031_c0_g1_i1.p1 TRINITY_DN2031_c0_g1~~TRINITY_DN2031_c0_g1_i1.p1  ORF type:complete len:769 (+),score=127.69 TRINITY_DN2031_c0_g1_i1:347-2653(+)
MEMRDLFVNSRACDYVVRNNNNNNHPHGVSCTRRRRNSHSLRQRSSPSFDSLLLIVLLLVFSLPPVVQSFSCALAGLPRTANEYYIQQGTTPTHGDNIQLCIDQDGIVYYPIPFVVGVDGAILREYIPVNETTNYSYISDSNYNFPCPLLVTDYERTNWTAIRVNTTSLIVDNFDGTFCTSYGCRTGAGPGVYIYFLAWAMSFSCGTFPHAAASANLIDTFWEFDYSYFSFAVDGAMPRGLSAYDITNSSMYINYYGSCGVAVPYSNLRASLYGPMSTTNAPPLYCDQPHGLVDSGMYDLKLKLSAAAPVITPPSQSISVSPSTSFTATLTASVSASSTTSVTGSITTSTSSSTSPTVSSTPSPTVTTSSTITATVSTSPTPSTTKSGTITISPTTSTTVSQTISSSPSLTVSQTISPSLTRSITVSTSETLSPSSQSQSSSVSPSITPSPSVSSTPSTTVSVSVSSSESYSLSASVSASASISESSSVSVEVSVETSTTEGTDTPVPTTPPVIPKATPVNLVKQASKSDIDKIGSCLDDNSCEIDTVKHEITEEEAKYGVAVPVTDRSGKVFYGQVFVPGGVLPKGCVIVITPSSEKRSSSESSCDDVVPDSIQFEVNLEGDCGDINKKHPQFKKPVEIQAVGVDRGNDACVAFFDEKKSNDDWKCVNNKQSKSKLSNGLAIYKGETDHFTTFAVLVLGTGCIDRIYWIISVSLLSCFSAVMFIVGILYTRSRWFQAKVRGDKAKSLHQVERMLRKRAVESRMNPDF